MEGMDASCRKLSIVQLVSLKQVLHAYIFENEEEIHNHIPYLAPWALPCRTHREKSGLLASQSLGFASAP